MALAMLSAGSAGCGIVEPDEDFILTVSGHVRTHEGTAVAGASVTLGHRDALGPQSGTIASTTSSAGGAFSFEVTAPAGYAFPNCATMTVYASSGEFEASYPLSWSDRCTLNVRRVEGVVVLLGSDG
jgi:hypothetical protein